jgi:hypothetical protein
MSSVAGRLAENEARFREANERVGAAVERLGIDQLVPFLCECGRRDCTTVIRVRPQDYERVRSDSRHFICAAGHEDGLPGSREVEQLTNAVVVEKLGEAADIADATDPRGDRRARPAP